MRSFHIIWLLAISACSGPAFTTGKGTNADVNNGPVDLPDSGSVPDAGSSKPFEDAPTVDSVPDHADAGANPSDAPTADSHQADTGVVGAQPDASSDATADASPIDCQADAMPDARDATSCATDGVMIRAESDSPNMPYTRIDALIGDGSMLQTDVCSASDDMDANPQIYQACLVSIAPPSGTLISFDMGYQGGAHLCTNDSAASMPCGRLDHISVWIKGQPASVTVGVLPDCAHPPYCTTALMVRVP